MFLRNIWNFGIKKKIDDVHPLNTTHKMISVIAKPFITRPFTTRPTRQTRSRPTIIRATALSNEGEELMNRMGQLIAPLTIGIADLQTTVGGLDTRMTSLETRMGSLETTVSDLKTTVDMTDKLIFYAIEHQAIYKKTRTGR